MIGVILAMGMMVVVAFVPSAIGGEGAPAEALPARLAATVSPGDSALSVGPTTAALVASTSPHILSGFVGLTQADTGTSVPDVQVAAGPTHIVELVNYKVAIFDKQGNRVMLIGLKEFFGATNTMFDPRVLYDAISGRWFASAAEYLDPARRPPTPVRLAVSTTSDPTGTWRIYLVTGRGDPDQPYIGVSDDKVIVSWNSFRASDGSWLGAEYAALRKADLLNGVNPPGTTLFNPEKDILGAFPVQSHSPTTTQYMVGRMWKTNNSVQFYAITGTPGVSAAAKKTIITTKVLGFSPDAPQPGTTTQIDTNFGRVRVLDASWSQGKLWFTIDSGCSPTGDTVRRACLRLTQLATAGTGVAIVQDFDFGITNKYLFYPALSMDARGNLGVIYGYSSDTDYPSLAVTGQSVTDALGSMKPPVPLKIGTASEPTPGPRTEFVGFPRQDADYGDYFGAGTDSSDPTVIWAAGEYHESANWSTFIGAFRVEDFALSATPSSLTIEQGLSTNSTIDLASFGGFSGTISLSASSSPVGLSHTLSPQSISITSGGTGSAILTVTAPSTTPTGNYLVTVSGTSGSLTSSTALTATVVAPAGGGGGGSVAHGSLITMADGRLIPVQNLRVGDTMLGYDTLTSTFITSTLQAINIVETRNMLVINTEAGMPFRVDANPHQILWVKEASGSIGWRPVTEIRVGDSLFTPHGWAKVTSIQFAPSGTHIMYDIIASAPYFANGYLDPPIKV